VGVTRYLADKSALARLHLPAVREALEPLITRALVGICGVTELEMLFSARNIQERSRMKEHLEASMDRIDTPEDIWDQAAEIQEALTEQAQHRSASIPDLIVAATARVRGLEILHYDRDFDTIARYTEQPVRWIVPPGTVLPLANAAGGPRRSGRSRGRRPPERQGDGRRPRRCRSCGRPSAR
jgi:predicted nucleic acid-binding protein